MSRVLPSSWLTWSCRIKSGLVHPSPATQHLFSKAPGSRLFPSGDPATLVLAWLIVSCRVASCHVTSRPVGQHLFSKAPGRDLLRSLDPATLVLAYYVSPQRVESCHVVPSPVVPYSASRTGKSRRTYRYEVALALPRLTEACHTPSKPGHNLKPTPTPDP